MGRTTQIAAYTLAGALYAIVGSLLMTDRTVPTELWTAGAAATLAAGVTTRRPGDVPAGDVDELEHPGE